MNTKFHDGTYEVEFTNQDAAVFTEGSGAPAGVVRGRGSFVFDSKTGDIVDAKGAAKGRAEIEWLAFSQDAQEFGRNQLAELGVRVNPYDFAGHMPELGRSRNPPARISRTRGVKTMRGPYSAAKGYTPWITQRGKLGTGFLTTMTKEKRRKALDRCVREHGYRSCLGSIMALERARSGTRGKGQGVGVKYAGKLREARDYLRDTYGGAGSFGPQRTALVSHAAEGAEPYVIGGYSPWLRNPPEGIDTSGHPKSWTALGAFVGSLAATVPGAAVGSGALMLLGSVLGAFAGGRYMAPPDRVDGAALGSAIGGIFTPVGAAIGGAIGAADPDTRAANPTPAEHAHAAYQYMRQAGVALGRAQDAVVKLHRRYTDGRYRKACEALAESRRFAFLAVHEAQNADGAVADVFPGAAEIDGMARHLQGMVDCRAADA